MVKKINDRESGRVLEVNKVYIGNCLEELRKLPSESIDMCVTSPPYWGLRDYGTEGQIWGGDPNCEHEFTTSKRKLHSGTNTGKELPHHRNAHKVDWEVEDAFCSKCGAWKGELGLEPTVEMFVNDLCDIFDEVKRVLTPHGSCWVNLGDTYANTGYGKGTGNMQNKNVPGAMTPKVKSPLPQKCLVQLPSRFAIAMTDRGWILRNEIIWYKPSCMPSSAKDRYTVDFEKLFFFTKSKNYYFKQQLEPLVTPYEKLIKDKRGKGWEGNKPVDSKKVNSVANHGGDKSMGETINPDGRNKRTVWAISPKGFKDAHFAVFPPELIESPIDAGCPEFVDKKTGKPRERDIEKQTLERHELPKDNPNYRPARYDEGKYTHGQRFATYDDKGYNDGRDDDEFRPGIVLDPFMGSGTTAEVAMKQDKDWVGIELNPDYVKISDKRLEPTIVKKKTRDKAKEFWG